MVHGPIEKRVLVSGASGLIGSALIPMLEQDGCRVMRLVRSREAEADDAVYWNPATGEIDRVRCEGMDVVIHLAGRNLGGGRLTGRRKREAVSSRVNGTALLASTLASLERKPRVLVSASGIGYYGERGNEILTEASARGTGFLADLSRDWEAATDPAAEAGIRVVKLRTGVVLARTGNPLKSMVPVFRLGLGSWLGRAGSWLTWISLTDHCRVFLHILRTDSLIGAVNSAAPEPVTQKQFSRMLGKVLRRPAWFPVPSLAMRARLGKEMADAAVWSQRVLPSKLIASGFDWKYPDLESTLRHELGLNPKYRF